MENNIAWLEAAKSARGHHTKEAMVSLMEIKGRQYTSIAFYEGAHLKITHNDYVSVGLTPLRIYFKEVATGNRGFKLVKQGNSKHVRIPRKLEQFVGDRSLYFDADNKLWYIGV